MLPPLLLCLRTTSFTPARRPSTRTFPMMFSLLLSLSPALSRCACVCVCVTKYKDIPDDVLPVTESLACVVKVCVCVFVCG